MIISMILFEFSVKTTSLSHRLLFSSCFCFSLTFPAGFSYFSQWWTIGSAGGPAGTTGLTSASWYILFCESLVPHSCDIHPFQVESRRHHKGLAAESCLCSELGSGERSQAQDCHRAQASPGSEREDDAWILLPFLLKNMN